MLTSILRQLMPIGNKTEESLPPLSIPYYEFVASPRLACYASLQPSRNTYTADPQSRATLAKDRHDRRA